MDDLAHRRPGDSLTNTAGRHAPGDIQTFRVRPDTPIEAFDERAMQMASTGQFIARLSDGASDALGFGPLREIHVSGPDRTCVVIVDQDRNGQHLLNGALAFKNIDPAELARLADGGMR